MSDGDLPPWIAFFTFSSVNTINVLIGCVMLGVASGLVGCFAFLRKRALIGDALAHAALPGVCVAFMLTGTKDPLIILVGAMISCWIGAFSVEWIVHNTRCKEDSALGMVLSVYFGVGMLLLSVIQQSGAASQSGLDHFLFGKAAALVARDVQVIGFVSVGILVVLFLGYKEFKLVSFDPDFAAVSGVPSKLIIATLATMVVLTVGIGLQTVGVVLIAALLITPAAAARYWTDNLRRMLILSGVFGGLSGAVGAYVSYLSPRMPTGPWIVVSVSTLFLLSLLFARKRGVLPRVIRAARSRRSTNRENILRTLYLLGERVGTWDDYHSIGELLQHRPMPAWRMARTLNSLERDGYVAETAQGLYGLTKKGRARAERLTRLHRLWEVYLTQRLELAPDHVHDDAEEIEHIITPELEARLMESLEHPTIDPHDRAIPGLIEGENHG